MAKDWQILQDEAGIWADATFGKRTYITGHCFHLVEEIGELYTKPKDILEFADILMLTLDAARISGFNMEQLYEAFEKKLDINKKREWEHHENGLIKYKKVS